MPKSNPLTKALAKPAAKRAAKPEKTKAAAVVEAPAASAKQPQASRIGRVLIGAHFDPQVQRQLRIIAATESIAQQELLAMGLNMVFAKYGHPEIANVGPQEKREKGAAA
jgi:antitoxin-like ribbon-helix-helix protein